MTTEELARLLDRRSAALEAMARDDRDLASMPPAERFAAEMVCQEFRETDRLILAHLRDQDDAVRVGDVVLHLTRDRMNFVELSPRTGRPIWISPSAGGWKLLLYRYPTTRTRRAAV